MRCLRWGTKWDVGGNDDSAVVSEQDGETTIGFCTAWEPPLPVIRAMSAIYPALVFEMTYCESGCGFAGEVRFVAGEGQDNYYEYGDPGYERIARDTIRSSRSSTDVTTRKR